LYYTKEIGKYDDYLAFIEKANQLQKLVWVFTGGDNGWSNFKLPDQGIHFRLAGFKSKYAMPTEILPAFIQDPLKDNQFSILDQSTTPFSIGFVGHADGSFKKWVKELAIHLKKKLTTYRSKPIDAQSFYPSGVKRFQNLKKLAKLDTLDTNFILRNKYRAGLDSSSKLLRKTSEEEFKENIQQNVFTFCMRGGGNFSIRFYETLAQGRIPFYLDTDTQLPLEDVIDWDKHIFMFNPSDSIAEIETKLSYFTSKINILEVQKNNRLLWQNSLTRKGYANQLYLKYKLN
ncbi:MAG: glycosyltransferase family 47 protein, partial [Flavobacteriaceae bacterium]|nr:glycosyltransferase family 47 protein [Flavobacteriaceae bacterium]